MDTRNKQSFTRAYGQRFEVINLIPEITTRQVTCHEGACCDYVILSAPSSAHAQLGYTILVQDNNYYCNDHL